MGYSKVCYNLYSKLSYNFSKIKYFVAKNSHYDTFFSELKHSLVKILILGLSVQYNFLIKFVFLQ